jgi:hypothetical protein
MKMVHTCISRIKTEYLKGNINESEKRTRILQTCILASVNLRIVTSPVTTVRIKGQSACRLPQYFE